MVNPNDPAAIPYVISEDDGVLWYVAYKERSPGIPYITVSAKGVANGLSTEYNDGYDFGPDSYNPNISSGIPVTQSGGLLEAWDYAVSVSYPNPTTGHYIMPMIKIIGSPIFINTNITLSGKGKPLETSIISGESSMEPYIICNVNSGYGITFDPSSLIDLSLRIENIQPAVGSGYTPEGGISIPNGSVGLIFEGYNIDISNGGWTGDPLSIYADSIYMWNYETYISSGASNGAFYGGNAITFVAGNLSPSTTMKFSGITGTGGNYSGPAVYLAGMGNSDSSAQGITFNIDTISDFVVDCPNLLVAGINFSDTVATNAGGSFPHFNVDLRNIYLDVQTNTSVFSASSSSPQTILNFSIKAITTQFLNSPTTSIDLFSNITVSDNLKLELEPIQLYGNTLIRPDQSITAGTTAGTVFMNEVEYHPQYKKILIDFSGYENDTTTAQTIDFPLAFSTSALISGNNTGLTVSATTSGITITAPDSTTTYNGIVIVEGY
jgi:hypothetical protein